MSDITEGGEGAVTRKRERDDDALQVRRAKGYCRPLLLEVAGYMEDALVQEVTTLLRVECGRYSPIMRTMFTLLSRPIPEEVLFGGAASSQHTPVFAAPHCAVSANKEHTIVPRLTRPAGVTAEAHRAAVRDALEAFLRHRCLPMAVTHNILRSAVHTGKGERRDKLHTVSLPAATQVVARQLGGQDVEQLVLRHYARESTRTASFLVADMTTLQAALIDPHDDTAPYEADLARLGCTLQAIVVTHCPLDVQLGVRTLAQRHAHARLVSGLPLREAGHRQPVVLGNKVSLVAVALPSFSPECVVVELRLCGICVALFTGPVWSTDAPPRADMYLPAATLLRAHGVCSNTNNDDGNDAVESLLCDDMDAVYAMTQRNLKRHLYEAYFLPSTASQATTEGTPSSEVAVAAPTSVDHVVLFPSHAGLNHVSHQQDAYWAVPVGAVLRMVHTRAVLDALGSEAQYAAYIARLPPLPSPALFAHVRHCNLHMLLDRTLQHESCALASSDDRGSSCCSCCCAAAVIDVRGLAAYSAWHLPYAMHVPMTFPADAACSTRAELWLQCLLLPRQPVFVVCAQQCEKPEVRRRVELVAPGSDVVVHTIDEVREEEEDKEKEGDSKTRPVSAPVVRLQSCEELALTTELSDTIVIDVRTPYEFMKGSHRHSISLPLAELCLMKAQDHGRASSSSASLLPLHNTRQQEPHRHRPRPLAAPSSQLGQDLLDKVVRTARATCGVQAPSSVTAIRRLVLYCANGERSLVAASLLARALAARAGHESGADIVICEVASGAAQIMRQRPDLWQTADRSLRA